MPRIGAVSALVLFLAVACPPSASALDPLLLLFLRTMRDQIALSLSESVLESVLKRPGGGGGAPPAAPPGVPPPGLPEPEQVRFLIERNFTYLPREDRERVYRAVMARLDDAADAEVRAQMLQEFTPTALAVGELQRALEKLSRGDKARLAASAALAFQRLPPAERASIRSLLEAGHMPIPQDLNALLLQEIAAR